jgi:DNA repair photolyase
MRRLNRTWGTDLRPLDLDLLRKKIENGLKNKNPQTPLARAIKDRKTIRLGNKTDPYQDAELVHQATSGALDILLEHQFSFVIQTKFTTNMVKDTPKIKENKDLVSLMPIISPGWENDWQLLEKSRTSPPDHRLEYAQYLQEYGMNVGVNGEPFIPGHHTTRQFRWTLRKLKEYKIQSYNTYHLHMNDLVAKKLHKIGLDIEKIWTMNQDKNWQPILRELIDIAQEERIELGCPDFVNSGIYQEKANTCCGLSVPNPCTFNIINWKKKQQTGMTDEQILEDTWDGIGDLEEGRKILSGERKDLYALKNIEEGLL